jgi:hypothetical protein
MKENLTKYLHVRLNENEHKKIEQLAKPYGSISKFLRSYLFSGKTVLIDPKSFIKGMNDLTIAVNRVGNNVNQIARFFNSTKDFENYPLMREWLDLFTEYNNLLLEVKKKLDNIYME